MNFIVALPLQIFLMGPIVRCIFTNFIKDIKNSIASSHLKKVNVQSAAKRVPIFLVIFLLFFIFP